MKQKIDYIKPYKWEVVVKSINKLMDKFVNDKRDTDSFYLRPEIQNFMEHYDFELWRKNDTLSKEIVSSMSLYFIVSLMVQYCLFKRVIIFDTIKVGNQKLDIPTFPRNSVPYHFKQTDKNGKPKDYSKLHSLSVMKDFYNKIDKRTINEIMGNQKNKDKM
jgi:hypothetical protein|tara:strand:- start:314 stop:796 length:483 start_codon:yes stop_codon:yes gene_type:complete